MKSNTLCVTLFVCIFTVFSLPRMADMFKDPSYFMILTFYLKSYIFKKVTDENNLLTVLVHLAFTFR